MAGKDPNKRPIIIKRIKKGGGGHHGGAWKVAYADFVTAMMAFFLLLWLISQVPKEKLVGLADYFEPTVGIKGNVGASLQGSIGNETEGVKQKPASNLGIVYGSPSDIGPENKAPEGPMVDIEEEAGQIKVNENDAEEIEAELEKKRFDEIKAEIEQAIENNANLAEFKQNLKIDQTEEGLRIQITDLEGMSMFESGSPNLKGDVKPLLSKLTEIIQKVDNKVAIIGHTDSKQYKGNKTNWELSADRANASRQFLKNNGLNDNRIYRVEGRADKQHFDPDPDSPKNRRISIILLKKSIAQ